MKAFCLHLAMNMAALFILSKVMPGITFAGAKVILFVALAMGLINYFMIPVIRFFTWPLNLLTLGLFSLFCNAAVLIFISHLIPGFQIDGFVSAILGAVILSFISYVLNWLIR